MLSGCLKTEITTGQQASNETVQLPWAHGFVNGLVPPVNGPLDVGEDCSNGVAMVDFRQNFVQWLAQGLTGSLYSPQQFTVTCASGGSMSSTATPPSYLLRDSGVTLSAAGSDPESSTK